MSGEAQGGRVCLVNGSLRGRKATSNRLLDGVARRLDAAGVASVRVAVRGRPGDAYPDETLAALAGADAVVLAFPLYAYCLPGGLMRLLEEWARYAERRRADGHTKVYAIVNCGFVLPETNAEAVRVVRNFSARLGLEWRFAVAVGAGPAVVATRAVDLRLRRATRRMVTDIGGEAGGRVGDVYLRPLLPRIIMDLVREHLDRKSFVELADAAASAGD